MEQGKYAIFLINPSPVHSKEGSNPQSVLYSSLGQECCTWNLNFLKLKEKHNKVYILKSLLHTLFNVILRMILGSAAHYSAIFSSMNLILLYI